MLMPCTRANLSLTMRITVNGKVEELASPCTLSEAVSQYRRNTGPCAVELNERLVPVDQRSEAQLTDGDRIEIVTLVGGG